MYIAPSDRELDLAMGPHTTQPGVIMPTTVVRRCKGQVVGFVPVSSRFETTSYHLSSII